MPAVSIIIPTYNHQDYVLETLASVFAQTFTDYEVIVVNDGSPDCTADLLKPLAAANRIRYIEQPNGGQAAARNRGLAEAHGEHVAFLDDDDVWPRDKLEWQVRHLRANSDLHMVAGSRVLMGETAVTGPDEPAHWVQFEELFYGSPLSSPGQALFRRRSVEEIGGFDEAIWGADDLDLYFRLARLGPIPVWIKTALFYRVHAANASRNLQRMFDNCATVVRKHLRTVTPSSRWKLGRRAYRFLYEYVGRELVGLTCTAAKSRNWALARSYAKPLHQFIRPAIVDPKLAWRLASQISVRSFC